MNALCIQSRNHQILSSTNTNLSFAILQHYKTIFFHDGRFSFYNNLYLSQYLNPSKGLLKSSIRNIQENRKENSRKRLANGTK